MSTRKRNEFLDSDHSDDDGSEGYNSELEELRKGGRGAKRRRVQKDDSDDEEEYQSDEQEEERNVTKKSLEPPTGAKFVTTKEVSAEPEQHGEKEIEELKEVEEPAIPKKRSRRMSEESMLPEIAKPLTKKNLVATAEAIKKSGVVYLSRIPPFMQPKKLRELLEPWGAINRIFLTPEDPLSRKKRLRNGGSKKQTFVDGWVEFVKKSEAKRACELLNTQIIGGKNKSIWHDDIWNLLYLKGFKWNNLTEQIAAENAERANRMRAEISKTTKENKEFVKNVERAKMLDGMQSKNAAKEERKADKDGGKNTGTRANKQTARRPITFDQTAVITKKAENQPDQVKRVLSKIF